MRALIHLVLIPLIGAALGGAVLGPVGVFLGLVVGFYAGGSLGPDGDDAERIAELERRLEEKEERIAELERRLAEVDEE